MGFGHRVYRAEDPRARVLRRTAERLGAPRFEAARALEQAALAELRERRPDRRIETNVEFWAAIVLDFAGVPATMFTSMFACARTAGWSAHILEQKRTGRLFRPSARYVGPAPRSLQSAPQTKCMSCVASITRWWPSIHSSTPCASEITSMWPDSLVAPRSRSRRSGRTA